MDKILLIAVLLALPIAASRQQQAVQTDSCLDKAKTQADVNDCAVQTFNKADVELNRVYQQLQSRPGSRRLV